MAGETTTGDRVRAGVSEAIDGGQQVIALFSVVDSTDHNILLMPPQVQLGGTVKSGKIIRRSHWATADQLPVTEFRLGKRRLGPGERADGVVLFERPPCPYNTRIVPTRTLIQDHDRGLSWLFPTSPRPPTACFSFPTYDLPHATYLPCFHQHSRLLLISPLFSYTFPLSPRVFHSRPLFSITLPRRWVKKGNSLQGW